MPRPARPRKAYRPRPLVDPLHRALTGVRLLEPRDVDGQLRIARTALAELGRGRDTAHHWRSLADTANMAESLAALGIGSGADALRVIDQAQQALAHMQQRWANGSSRALYAGEIAALQWLISLHALQLGACSFAEFDLAFRRTRERIAQARAGNAPAGAIVIEGQIA